MNKVILDEEDYSGGAYPVLLIDDTKVSEDSSWSSKKTKEELNVLDSQIGTINSNLGNVLNSTLMLSKPNIQKTPSWGYYDTTKPLNDSKIIFICLYSSNLVMVANCVIPYDEFKFDNVGRPIRLAGTNDSDSFYVACTSEGKIGAYNMYAENVTLGVYAI